MKRKEVYRCYSLYHSRKEYGECQDSYSDNHSVSVELLRLHIPHICDYEAIDSQEHDSDCYNGYEYQQHPEYDTGCRRVRYELADISYSVTEADHTHNKPDESVPQVHKELYGTFN